MRRPSPYETPWDKSYLAEYIEGYWENPNEQALRRAIADWVGPGDGTLLDVGCGSARIAPMLRGWVYHGVDGSAKLLGYATPRVRRQAKACPAAGRLVRSDITKKLPYADGQFDAVLCMQVLRHLESYEGVLAEMVRVAKRAVYIVDMWTDGAEHVYSTTEMAHVVFPNNTWALAALEAEAVRLGCTTARTSLVGLPWAVTAVRLTV